LGTDFGDKELTTGTQELTTYREGFGGFEKSAAGNRLAWLRNMRRDAFARFAESGIPTTKAEDWRFTNLSSLAQTPFRATGLVLSPRCRSKNLRSLVQLASSSS